MKRIACLAAVVAMGCGDDDQRAEAPAQVTPVPTAEAPVPTPEDEIHASPTPGVTATPAATEDAGDEAGIKVPVAIEVGPRGVEVEPPVVAAFLPLHLTIHNARDEELTLVVLNGKNPVARVDVAAGGKASAEVPGQKATRLEILSPQLGAEATAILRVEPGGG